jgi:hypothetical protein
VPASLADETGAATIQTAINLLGAGGDRWIRGRAEQLDGARGGYDYCVVGALIAAASTYADYETAFNAVRDVVGSNVARWNNSLEVTWPDVQLTLRRAANNLREGA